jgi:hypothetical protein
VDIDWPDQNPFVDIDWPDQNPFVDFDRVSMEAADFVKPYFAPDATIHGTIFRHFAVLFGCLSFQ